MKLPSVLRVLVFSLFSALVTHAADFEGTLKWSFKAEVTDPAMKKQMADAQAQLADPAKLAEMKAMLENPQMKAMMAQNPEMKAALEAQIKLGEDAAAGKGGDMISAMMPSAMTLQAKAGRTHLQIEGGVMPVEVIGRTSPPEATMIDRKARTFSRVPPAAADTSAEKVAHKVTKIPVTTQILGYTCEQYLVETTQNGKPMVGVFWATDDIAGLDASALSQARLGGESEDAFMREIDGVPLRMEMTLPQMMITVEAVSIRAGAVAAASFEVPAGYTEKPYVFGPAAQVKK